MPGQSTICIDLTESPPRRKESDDEPCLATEAVKPRQEAPRRRTETPDDEVIEIHDNESDEGDCCSGKEDVDPRLGYESRSKESEPTDSQPSSDDDVEIVEDPPRPVVLELGDMMAFPNPSNLLGKRKEGLPKQTHPSKIIQAEKRRKKERRQYLELERLKAEQAARERAEQAAKRRAEEEEAKREAARRNFIIIDDSSDEENIEGDDDDDDEVEEVEVPSRTPRDKPGSPSRRARSWPGVPSPKSRTGADGPRSTGIDEEAPVQPNGFQRRRRTGTTCPPFARRKSGESQSSGYRFDNRRDYNWNFSQEEALEYQERLFREAAERLRKQSQEQAGESGSSQQRQHRQQYYNDHVMHSTRNSYGIPLITEPMHDIAARYPLHYSWSRDPYAVLGLPPGSALSMVRTQYRRLARLYHPDKSQTSGTIHKFHGISRAYRKLTAES